MKKISTASNESVILLDLYVHFTLVSRIPLIGICNQTARFLEIAVKNSRGIF